MSDGSLSNDEAQWREEAQAVIGDIQAHVDSITISNKLCSSCKRIYLNLVTLEKREFCIELTASGFKIVGNKVDTTEGGGSDVFETPYSLLESVSPGYRQSFGQQLIEKLTRLQKEQNS